MCGGGCTCPFSLNDADAARLHPFSHDALHKLSLSVPSLSPPRPPPVAGKPFNPVTKGKALAGLAHSLSMSELGMSEQIRLALNTIGAMDFGRVRTWARGRGGGGAWGGAAIKWPLITRH